MAKITIVINGIRIWDTGLEPLSEKAFVDQNLLSYLLLYSLKTKQSQTGIFKDDFHEQIRVQYVVSYLSLSSSNTLKKNELKFHKIVFRNAGREEQLSEKDIIQVR